MAKKGSSKLEISFSQACEGMIAFKRAIGLSEHTISDYPAAPVRIAVIANKSSQWISRISMSAIRKRLVDITDPR